MHKTYHIVGELLARRWRNFREDRADEDSILVDFVICGATQEASALWLVRDVATAGADYYFAGWQQVTVEEVTN